MQTVSSNVYRALGLLTPYDINIEKRIVGGDCDGAYVLADNLAQNDILSIGVDHNDNFDYELATAGHRVFMFDHTIPGPPRTHESYRFHKIGICGEHASLPDCTPLSEILSIIDSSSKLILKIDVEGSEWEVFSSAPHHVLARFDQILVEVHWLEKLGENTFRFTFCEALRRINNQFTLFHVHANNNGNVNIVEGFPIPSVLELSYIKTDLVDRRRSSTVYPSRPGFSNNKSYHELPLLFYPFLPLGIPDEAMDEMMARIEQQFESMKR